MKTIIRVASCSLLTTLAQATTPATKPSAPSSTAKKDALVIRWTDVSSLNNTGLALEKLTELQLINDQAASDVQRKQEELRLAEQSFNAKKSTLSKAARESEESRLIALKTELANLIETSKIKVSRAVQEKTEEMVSAVEAAATAVAKREGVDVIIDQASGRTLYVAETALVTDALVSEINKQFELKVAKNKDANTVATQKKATVKA